MSASTKKRPAKQVVDVSPTPAPSKTAVAFKVLVDGASCHGGTMRWSLPSKGDDGTWTPGDWHAVRRRIAICSNGLHLTRAPINWWVPGSAVYEAEYEDIEVDVVSHADDKIAVRRCRLLREVSWEDHQVWTHGEHAIRSGLARASDSATVEASGSATVEAFGSATVEASGSATVKAFGSATVKAFDSATVKAFDSATVKAFGSATVEAFGSATVEAFDSATVKAFGSATVKASRDVNVIRTCWHSGGWIKLADAAAVIDRRKDGTVEFHAAPYSDAPESEGPVS